MKNLNDWYCDFKIDSSSPITVGQKFAILCQGQSSLNLNITPVLEFKNEDDAYKFVILRHKFKSENELFVLLTTWQTGNHSLKDIKLVLDSDYILLKPPTLKVQSVLEKKEEFNLPPGPLLKKPPEILWYLLVFTAFASIIYFVKLYKRTRRVDRGMLKLNTFKTSLSPFYEFQKQIRSSKKIIEKPLLHDELKELCTQIYKNIIIFVSLQINSPLFVLNEKEIPKALNKKILDKKLVTEFFYITKELKKTSADLDQSSNLKTLQSDFGNLLDEANDFSQKLNKYFIGVKSK